MKLPYLTPAENAVKKYVVAFRGLNYGEGWQDGDIADCRNISSELYPAVTQRAARTVEGEYTSPLAVHAKNGLVVMANKRLYYNGELKCSVTDGKKQVAVVGNMMIIFPDKIYIDLETGEREFMEAYTILDNVTFTSKGISEPGQTWPFRVGDAIKIIGCVDHRANNKTVIIRSIDGDGIWFDDNSMEAGEEERVTLRRMVPDLDFICESNYRLWGTKGNTIYASKYGDPLNFEVFDGLTSDSYYIDVASDGEFTGCIPYSSHICFFKENTLHKLYGSKPSNYQLVNSQVYGVQAGSEGSMCIVNESLLYKGVNGIYSYTGSVPELISDKFGARRFSDAVAASDGERYYISMRSGDVWGLYVYDVLRDLWLKEDDLHAVDMAFSDGYVYILAADGKLYKIDRTADRSGIEWSLEFCPFTEAVVEKKTYSRFFLRVELAEDAWIGVQAAADDGSRWEKVFKAAGKGRVLTIPILPTRCDSLAIRLYGEGECLLRTFVREVSVRGDV